METEKIHIEKEKNFKFNFSLPKKINNIILEKTSIEIRKNNEHIMFKIIGENNNKKFF